jgi:hypothetical protein
MDKGGAIGWIIPLPAIAPHPARLTQVKPVHAVLASRARPS